MLLRKERGSRSRRAMSAARWSSNGEAWNSTKARVLNSQWLVLMLRSTKIVATLGPSSSEPVVLERMVRAGVDVVRLNFSHGTAEDHLKRAALVKEIASRVGRTVAIMCDLQG